MDGGVSYSPGLAKPLGRSADTFILLIFENDMAERNKIYKGKQWEEVRSAVLKYDHYECQRCAGNYMPDPSQRRHYTRAVLVHHHFHVEDYPEYKYQMFVEVNGKKVRNLYSLCQACHEAVHVNERHRFKAKGKDDEFTNQERWD